MKSAFTKKDLTVVLGCIVFMLANLGAIGHSGRTRAKEALCQAKLKQWSLAFRLYAEDNNSYFPFPMYNSMCYPYSFAHSWWPVMRPYFTDYDMLYCPMATKTDAEQPYWAWSYGSIAEHEKPYVRRYPGQYTGSYGVNAWIFSFSAHTGCDHGDNMGSRFGGYEKDVPAWRWRRMDMKGADNVPLFADSAITGCRPRHTDIPAEFQEQAGEYPVSAMGDFCIDRHNCGVNCAFADGSAKKVGLKQLWRLKWHRQFDTTKGPLDGKPYPVGWPDWMKDCKSY